MTAKFGRKVVVLTSNPNMSMMAMTFLSLLTSLWPLLPRRLRFPGEEEEALGEHTLFTLATTLKKGKKIWRAKYLRIFLFIKIAP